MKGPYLPFDYPDRDLAPLSIDDPFTIGRSVETGQATQLYLAEGGGFVVGKRGSGVTMLLQNITASLARMPDTIVWHIDLNNGSLSASWLIEDNDVVDWVAVTEEEALKMLRAGIRIAKRRRASYQAEILRNNATVLRVLPERPQIVILVEKDAPTDSKIGQAINNALAELARIGPATRVTVVSAHLSATGDYLSSMVRKCAQFALCGPVKDAVDVAVTFDHVKDVPVPTQRGRFVLRDGDGIDEFDAYRLMPAQIRKIGQETVDIRSGTALDEASELAAGDDYATRWSRPDTVQWLDFLRGEEVEFPDIRATEATDDGLPEEIETLDDVIAAVKALLRRAKKDDGEV